VRKKGSKKCAIGRRLVRHGGRKRKNMKMTKRAGGLKEPEKIGGYASNMNEENGARARRANKETHHGQIKRKRRRPKRPRSNPRSSTDRGKVQGLFKKETRVKKNKGNSRRNVESVKPS